MLFNVKNFSSILDWLCNRNSNSLEKIIILLQEKKKEKKLCYKNFFKKQPWRGFFFNFWKNIIQVFMPGASY